MLAWQRNSLALMAFGFVIERFSLFLAVVRREAESPARHLFSLLVGVALILVGVAVAVLSSNTFLRFVRDLRAEDVPTGHWSKMGIGTNLLVAAIGSALAIYLMVTAL